MGGAVAVDSFRRALAPVRQRNCDGHVTSGFAPILVRSKRFGSGGGRSWAWMGRVSQSVQDWRGYQRGDDGHDDEHCKEHRRKDA
jgi:hypothetical protein